MKRICDGACFRDGKQHNIIQCTEHQKGSCRKSQVEEVARLRAELEGIKERRRQFLLALKRNTYKSPQTFLEALGFREEDKPKPKKPSRKISPRTFAEALGEE